MSTSNLKEPPTTTPLPAEEFERAISTGTTLFAPNYYPDQSFLKFPSSGNVYLTYRAGSPSPKEVYIFHQGGATTRVTPGWNTYSVSNTDHLIVIGDGASCKIEYFYMTVA